MVDPFFFALIFGGMLVGIQGERWRAAWARSEWRRKRRQGRPWRGRARSPLRVVSAATDSVDQLRQVMGARFEKRRLLSRTEERVFRAAEQAVARTGKPWRVMAQVCLGEILKSESDAAFRAINSKRVDLLVVCDGSLPLAAIEYQGEGHHQGTAPARDAVKKEALRKAGVRFIEITPRHGPQDVAREISRLAGDENPKAA